MVRLGSAKRVESGYCVRKPNSSAFDVDIMVSRGDRDTLLLWSLYKRQYTVDHVTVSFCHDDCKNIFFRVRI